MIWYQILETNIMNCIADSKENYQWDLACLASPPFQCSLLFVHDIITSFVFFFLLFPADYN